MNRKLPLDSFDHYMSLGVNRSYQAVADHYGVSKVAVVNLAKKENWQKRLRDIEQEARRRSDESAVDQIEAMNERHLKAARVIQAKALEGLRTESMGSAMEAVRALDMGMKQERLIVGEPTDRSALSVEDVIKREYREWMTTEGDDDAGPDDGQRATV